jgi:hypothetical protein
MQKDFFLTFADFEKASRSAWDLVATVAHVEAGALTRLAMRCITIYWVSRIS